MRLLRSFLALTPLERRVLVKATLLLTLIKLGLGRLPFTLLRRLVAADVATGTRREHEPHFAEVVAWAVAAANQRVPGRGTCLTQAMAAQALLSWNGYPSRLQVGVARGAGGQVEGHAWVEYEGRIVVGGTKSEVSRYTPLAAFDAERAIELRAIEPLRSHR
jgi:hypothetical protein